MINATNGNELVLEISLWRTGIIRERVFSSAVQAPVSHIGMPGFNSGLGVLSPTFRECSYLSNKQQQLLLLMWETWIELSCWLWASARPSPCHCGYLGSKPLVGSTFFLSLFPIYLQNERWNDNNNEGLAHLGRVHREWCVIQHVGRYRGVNSRREIGRSER